MAPVEAPLHVMLVLEEAPAMAAFWVSVVEKFPVQPLPSVMVAV